MTKEERASKAKRAKPTVSNPGGLYLLLTQAMTYNGIIYTAGSSD